MTDIADRHEPERKQKEKLEELFNTTSLTQFEMFRNFPVLTPRYNLARFLTHYEIFKKISNIPGSIVDLGVYRGSSLFSWAKLCEIFCPTDVRKIVYGFDTFEGFVNISEQDGPENLQQDVKVRGYYAGSSIENDLRLAQEAMNCDRHLNHIERIELIKGDVSDTIPEFVKTKGQGFRVALLNLDLDLYEPTLLALEYFVPLMTSGGIIILDEYAVDTFGGESTAVDEYFIKNFGKRPKFNKFTWHSNPSAFIEVDW